MTEKTDIPQDEPLTQEKLEQQFEDYVKELNMIRDLRDHVQTVIDKMTDITNPHKVENYVAMKKTLNEEVKATLYILQYIIPAELLALDEDKS